MTSSSLLAALALAFATGPALAQTPAPEAAANRLVVGDLHALAQWIVDRPGMRQELLEGSLPIALDTHGIDPTSIRQAIDGGFAAYRMMVPRRVIIEAPAALWRQMAHIGAPSRPADMPPGLTVGARAEFASPATARLVASVVVPALDLQPDGADRWQRTPRAPGAADYGPADLPGPIRMALDGSSLTLSVGGGAIPKATDDASLLSAR